MKLIESAPTKPGFYWLETRYNLNVVRVFQQDGHYLRNSPACSEEFANAKLWFILDGCHEYYPVDWSKLKDPRWSDEPLIPTNEWNREAPLVAGWYWDKNGCIEHVRAVYANFTSGPGEWSKDPITLPEEYRKSEVDDIVLRKNNVPL